METSFIAGSRFDPPNKRGLAHFAEHIILSGTKEFPSKDVLAGYLEDYGGSVGASTSSDLVTIKIGLGDASDFLYGVNLLSEILNNALFDENTIENERKVIIRELESKVSNTGKALGVLSKELLYQKTEIELTNLGTPETINNITKPDLLDFYNHSISANNCGITLCGDLDSEQCKGLLEETLKLGTGDKRVINTALPLFRDKVRSFKYFNTPTTNIDLSFRTTSVLDKDFRSIAILSSILTGGRTGTLKRKLRYERGLIYTIASGGIARIDSGDFGINCGVTKEKVQETIDIICSELKRMGTQGPTEEELNLTKNRIIKSVKIPMQTVANIVDTHNYRNIFCPDLNWTVDNELEAIEKIEAKDIQEAVNKYVLNNKWYLSMTGPVDQAFLDSIQIDL